MTNEALLCKGLVERIGIEGSVITHTKIGMDEKFQLIVPMEDHKDAISHVLMAIQDENHGVVKNMSEIGAVGHRVVSRGRKVRSFSAHRRSCDRSAGRVCRAGSSSQSA